MFRWVIIAAAFLPALSAQTTSTEPAPIALSGAIESFNGVPKLVESVQNSSTRAIQGFVFVTTFTDPDTGAAISKSNRGCYRQLAAGPALPAGPGTSVPAKCRNGSTPRGSVIAMGAGPEPIGNPLSVPASPSGAPAKYSFTVDLVFFSDGTTWGPANTGAARNLLMLTTGSAQAH
jgi:hypothetical protein